MRTQVDRNSSSQPTSAALPKVITLALAGLGVLAPTMAGMVQARDDAGMHEFFLRQSGSTMAPTQTPRTQASILRTRAAGRALRSSAPRIRYASLPRADEANPRQAPRRPAIAGETGRPDRTDPVGALMRDSTLRPGDIVVLADGPKVFRGDVGSSHKASDFENVDRSRLVSKVDRKLLLALMKPEVGPAKEAGRYAGASGKPALQGPDHVQARSDVRVVYPSALR